MNKMNLRVRFNCTSRMAQQERAGPITQRSVDQNYLLLKKNLYVQKLKSKTPGDFFKSNNLCHPNLEKLRQPKINLQTRRQEKLLQNNLKNWMSCEWNFDIKIFDWNKITLYILYQGLKLMKNEQTSKKAIK